MNRAAIYSRWGADPDLSDLVQLFVDEIPQRVACIREAWQSGDREQLRRVVHQMKGAGGSYGFELISGSAALIEDAIDANKPEEDVRQSLESFWDLCSRIRAGVPDCPLVG